MDGVARFPIALSPPPPLGGRTPAGVDALDEVVGAGINFLRIGPRHGVWTDDAIADAGNWNAAAAARGIHTWIALGELAHAQPDTPEDAQLQQVVTALKDSPGFGIWKGQDEPFQTGRTAASLKHAFDATSAIDPDHLFVIIEAPRGTAADLAPYSAVCSGHGVDIYPVRFGNANPDLSRVGRWTRTLRSITPSRAVFTTLQICFSGSDDPAGSGAFVLPTHRQARYMAYDAIINGARGLIFFGGANPHCLHPADATLGWNWTFWNDVLKRLVAEIGAARAAPPGTPRAGDRAPTTHRRPGHRDMQPPGRRFRHLGDHRPQRPRDARRHDHRTPRDDHPGQALPQQPASHGSARGVHRLLLPMGRPRLPLPRIARGNVRAGRPRSDVVQHGSGGPRDLLAAPWWQVDLRAREVCHERGDCDRAADGHRAAAQPDAAQVWW